MLNISQLFKSNALEESINDKWPVFVGKIEKLKADYPNADIYFYNKVDDFCSRLKNGYAISITNSKGYSLANNWVLDAFNDVFSSYLEQSYPLANIVNLEFCAAHLELPIKQHLNQRSCLEVARRVRIVSEVLETQIVNLGENSHQLLQHSETLCFLSNLLYLVGNNFELNKNIKWCECCFRRATIKSKFCTLHSSTKENNNKVEKLYRKQLFKSIRKKWVLYQSFRIALETNQNFAFNQKVTCFNNGQFHFDVLTICADSISIETSELALETNWLQNSLYWDQIIESFCPYVYKKLSAKPSSFNTWNEFVISLRIVFDESVEKNQNPNWIMCELAMAEQWFRYERFQNIIKFKVNYIVLILNKKNLTVKEIENKVNLKKSQIYKIINESNLNFFKF